MRIDMRLRRWIVGTALVLLAAGTVFVARRPAPREGMAQRENPGLTSAPRGSWAGVDRLSPENRRDRGSLRIVSPAAADVLRGSREVVVLPADGEAAASIHVSLDGKRVWSGTTPVRWLLDPGTESLANGEHVLAAWSSSVDGPAPAEVRFLVDISHGFAVREVVPAASGPATRLTINGSGFRPDVKVMVGGALASVELATSTTLRVRTPDQFGPEGGGVVVERDGQIVEAPFQTLAEYRPPRGSAQPPAIPANAVAMKLVEGTQAYASGGVLASRGLDEVGSLSVLIAQVGGLGVVDEDGSDPGYRAVHDAAERASGEQMFDMSQLFVVPVAEGTSAENAAAVLSTHPLVELAYVLPRPNPELPGDIQPFTCSMEVMQDHLQPSNYPIFSSARGGMNVTDAWNVLPDLAHAVRGRFATIVDVEYGWYTDHEDLSSLSMLSYLNSPYPELSKSHGTAVAGLLVADDDAYGMVGIVPEANLFLYNAASDGFDAAGAPIVPGCTMLRRIVSLVPPPAVILMELQSTTGTPWEDPNDEPSRQTCIRELTIAGYVFIEPAGNGGKDLDEITYTESDNSVRPAFPVSASGVSTSGAIIVAAVDGYYHMPLPSSSTGARVDLNAWGSNVATTGYCDAFAVAAGATHATCPGGAADCGSPDLDLRQGYTSSFGNTSAAAAQVAGAVAALLSVDTSMTLGDLDTSSCWDAVSCSKAADLARWLAEYGTPSQESASVGMMPDVRRAVCAAIEDTPCHWCGVDSTWQGCVCGDESCSCDRTQPCGARECRTTADEEGTMPLYYDDQCECTELREGVDCEPKPPVDVGCEGCGADDGEDCACNEGDYTCRSHWESVCVEGNCRTWCVHD